MKKRPISSEADDVIAGLVFAAVLVLAFVGIWWVWGMVFEG